MTRSEMLARESLIRALWELRRYRQGTVGERDAIHKLIPEAIEKMIEAKVEAMFGERFIKTEAKLDATLNAATEQIIQQMKEP